jgi:hypothetical protein
LIEDKNTMTAKPKIPIIYYEEPKPGDPVNPIPYIEIGLKEDMPKVLFISEYKETGEFDVDTGQGSMPIVDMIIHKFVDLEHLKSVLKPKQYDKVRVALGMEPLKQAQKAGKPILEQIKKNAELRAQQLKNDQSKRAARAFTLGEDLKQKSENYLKNEEN